MRLKDTARGQMHRHNKSGFITFFTPPAGSVETDTTANRTAMQLVIIEQPE